MLPLIFVRIISFISSGFPRRKLSWYQTCSLALPILSLRNPHRCNWRL
ncbi:hypothetical protein ACHAWT_001861, partial [Skeletonema menzelii]